MATSYDQAVLADSPAAYWRLGEASGSSAADSSGNGNGGQLQGGVTLGAPALINDANTSASFDGDDDRVYFADSASLSPDQRDQPRGLGTTQRRADSRGLRLAPVSKWNTGSLYIRRRPTRSSLHHLRQRQSSYGVDRHGTTTVAAGSTYHVVGTYDGATLRIYVNGALEGTSRAQAQSTTPPSRPSPEAAGAPSQPGFEGRLDETAIYGNALSADAEYRRTTPPARRADYASTVLADSPAAYWRLGEGSGSSAADSSGNGNGGSYSGGVTLGAPALINDPNTSASFDGNDDRMYFSDSASLSPTAAISLEAWVRPNVVPTAAGSGWHLISKWNTALLYIQGGASPKFVFTLYDSGTSSYGPDRRRARPPSRRRRPTTSSAPTTARICAST